MANPTTQGLSLRGLGSSGASRTLVVWDGVPVNDPFGGWVYWTRLSPSEIDRIEVSRGASTSLFGDRAMSGVLSMWSPQPRSFATAGYDGGNLGTNQASVGGGHLWNRFAASANLRAFTSDGYYIVREDRRGTADTKANVRFLAGNTRLDWLASADRLFVRLDILAEERDNGTRLTHNSTSLGTIAANYSHAWTDDTLSLLGYHTRGEYRASFSAVAANRNVETLTSIQQVPSEAVGAAGIWSHRAFNWNLLGGADFQRVEGVSTDRLVPTGERVGGGSQTQQGTFVQGDLTKGMFKMFLGGRYQFAGRGNEFFSPSGGLIAGRGPFRGRFSAWRAFRAPTLNELYRPFRAGNAETLANDALQPETVFGMEAGLDYVGENARLSVSVFRNDLADLITNVTIRTTGNQITRQRQNAAEALTRGVDVNARWNWRRWIAEAGWLYSDSRFGTGERIPQVPRHSGNAQLTWSNGSTFASAGLRAFDYQFEDDLNNFLLPGYAAIQMSWVRKIGRGVSVSAEVENLLDREIVVGYSPLPLIGTPLSWRLGVRWSSPSRMAGY